MSQHDKYELLNSLTDGVLIIQDDFTIVFANQQSLRLYGVERKEIVDQKCFTALHHCSTPCPEKNIAHDQCGHKQVFATGQPTTVTHPHTLPDGSERIFQISISPLFDETGKVDRIIHIAKDITERKQNDERLYIYERILSTTSELMSFVDTRYIYQAVNDAYCKAHGKKQEEIVGKSVMELHGPSLFDSTIRRHLDRSFAGERICYEEWFDYPGEGRRYMEVTYYPFTDENRIVTGTVVTCCDITERKKSEDSLRESEAKYTYLYNNLNDAAFIIGMDGFFLDTNEVAQKRLGYSREEFRNLSPEQIDAPECVSGHQKRFSTVQETGSLFFETIHISKDGRAIPTEISARFIKMNGESCVLALARDISERKDAEIALRESEYRFREIFNNISNGIAIYEAVEDGSDFIIKNLNPAGLTSSRIQKDDILNKSVLKVFPGIVDMGLFEIFQKVYRTGESITQPAAFYKDEKIVLWVENFVCKLPSGEIVAVYDDITERKQAEQELAKSKEEWERTFDSFTDIVTLQDPSMRIVKVNKAGCQVLGISREEILSHHCHELFHDSTEPCTACPLLETKKDFHSYTREMYHKKLDKTFLVSAAPVLDANGRLEYIAHVAKDISDMKKLEQDLFQAQKMEAIGTLAGGIAHDFNNILSGIIGYSELIQTELPPNSTAARDIVEVIDAGKRAAELVKQILTFSRKTESNKTPLHPHLIVKEALKLLRSTLPTTVRIEEDIDSNCGTILADPTNIHQTVINLCTNGLHAMAEEKGTLAVSLQRQELRTKELNQETEGSPGPFIILSVSDTGCGMDPKTLERIFEPYFTTKGVGTGTGLGLAVIHGIAQSAQGFVRVTSRLGEGSTFTVYLPALQEDGDKGDERVELVSKQHGNERILIVDDEVFLVKVTQRQLENLGYHVTGTTDSKDALEKIRTDPDGFDLLITDQTMPGLTGAELAMAVKKIKPAMPIILCTGHSSVLTKEKSQTIGIDRYIGKPIIGNELSDTVRLLLNKKQ